MSMTIQGSQLLDVLAQLSEDWEHLLPTIAEDRELWDRLRSARDKVDREFDKSEHARFGAQAEVKSAYEELHERAKARKWIVNFQAASES